MNVSQLINNAHANEDGVFVVSGQHGHLTARPDGAEKKNANDKMEQTYSVDVVYYEDGLSVAKELHESGFRLSTVCCMCACVSTLR